VVVHKGREDLDHPGPYSDIFQASVAQSIVCSLCAVHDAGYNADANNKTTSCTAQHGADEDDGMGSPPALNVVEDRNIEVVESLLEPSQTGSKYQLPRSK
jgi:hypothetical protein